MGQQMLPNYSRYCRGWFTPEEKYAIGKSPGFAGTLFRGVDMSHEELAKMRDLGRFYMPSFTSTSRDQHKAFGDKNTLIIIDGNQATWTLKVSESDTDYDEDEVLLSCYTLSELTNWQAEPDDSVEGGSRFL